MLGWDWPDPQDLAALTAALEDIVADWRVAGRYSEPIARTLRRAAADIDSVLHPQVRERVLPPLPPPPGSEKA